jgi:hypothetical protein
VETSSLLFHAENTTALMRDYKIGVVIVNKMDQVKFKMGIGLISNLLFELGFSKKEILHICADIANKHYEK